MPNQLTCPNGHVLAITPAMEGKRIRCPKCKAILDVPLSTAVMDDDEPAAPPPLPGEGVVAGAPRRRSRADEDDDERPRRRSRRDDDDEENEGRPRRRRTRDDDDDDEPRSRRSRYEDVEEDDEDDEKAAKAKKRLRRRQLLATSTGLLMYYWKFIVYVTAVLAFMGYFLLGIAAGVGVAAGGGGPGGAGQSFAMLAMFSFLYSIAAVYVIGPILGVIGGAFIVRVPSRTGARGLAIATLVLEIIPVVCFALLFLNGIISFRGPTDASAALGLVLAAATAISLLAGFILTMLFLRQVASYFRDKATAKDCIALMVAFLITLIAGPFVIGASGIFLVRLLCIGVLILLALMLGWLIILIKQLMNILGVIAVVRARI